MPITYTVWKGGKDGQVRPVQVTKDGLDGDDVLVGVTASGLCGTDLHFKSLDMGLGHEGVGVVKATGPAVKQLKIGDRVGWGYIHDTCGDCKQCLKGFETYCSKRQTYGQSKLDQGSIATAGVWREAFLFRIPYNMTDEDAAPLMCGGATVFTVLTQYGVKPTDRVGVVGIGGLGHLAIQFAAKMGCEVTVFSGTKSKEEEAKKLGASSFYATKDVKSLDIGPRKLDALIVTQSGAPDWKLFFELMEPQGVIFPLGISYDDLSVPYMSTLLLGLHIQGSIVAPRQVHREMIQFAAQHGIAPMLNKYEMTEKGVAQCFEDLENGKMRYRGVMVVPAESRI